MLGPCTWRDELPIERSAERCTKSPQVGPGSVKQGGGGGGGRGGSTAVGRFGLEGEA